MANKKIGVLTLMIGLAAACFAQNLPRVVVIPLENRAGDQHEKDVETLTELLVNRIKETQRLNVIDRLTLNAAMAEWRWSMDDWTDNNKAAQMGRVLDAQYIVRGTVTLLGNSLIVSARIFDISTAEVLGSADVQLENMAEAYTKLNDFAQNLTPNPETPVQTTQWKRRWLYLGPTLGGGYVQASNFVNTSYLESGLFVLGAVVDLDVLNWLSITARPSLDLVGHDGMFHVPLMLRFGGKPGKVEITGNIGWTLGIPISGLTTGFTLGFKVGRAEILFLDLEFVETIGGGYNGFMFNGYAGIKFGIVDKR